RATLPPPCRSLALHDALPICLAGGRLGAIADVVPAERFEPDAGPESDLDELREKLAVLLEPVDAYVEVVDPLDPDLGVTGYQFSDRKSTRLNSSHVSISYAVF